MEHLGLSDNNLTGSIPDLSALTNLRSLSLAGNNLTGSIPDLSALTNLRSLSLAGNNLTGSIPDLSALTNLGFLGLSDNNLTGSIPDLSALTNLGVLNLAGNNLTGSIPDLNALTNLGFLGLSDNNLTGSIPDLSALTNLTSLSLASNNLTGSIPDLSALVRLSYLTLHSNPMLTGGIATPLGSLPTTTLGNLSLCNTDLNGALPAALETRRMDGTLTVYTCASIGDASAPEGEPLEFIVTHDTFPLQGGSAGGAIIYYKTEDGTATSGADYTGGTGSIMIPSNEEATDTSNSATIRVETLSDTVSDPSETFSISFTSSSSGTVRSKASATGTIKDVAPTKPTTDSAINACTSEEGKPWPTFNNLPVLILCIKNTPEARVFEVGESTEVFVKLVAGRVGSGGISLDLETDTEFGVFNKSIAIGAGEKASKTVYLTVNGGVGKLKVKIPSGWRNPSDCTLNCTQPKYFDYFLGFPNEATLDIRAAGTLGDLPSYSDSNGVQDSVVVLPDNQDRSALTDSTAKDYSAVIADVRVYAAETGQSEGHQERWRRVLAAFGDDNGYKPMTAAEAQQMSEQYSSNRWDPVVAALTEIETATAANTPPVVSIADATVTEGGQARFAVSLDKIWTDDVTVAWNTADGTADSGDYAGQSAQTLTIPAGRPGGAITVQTTNDSMDEDSETFTVALDSPANAIMGDDTGEATITDDDPAPGLSIDDVTVAEGGAARFTVQLDAVSGKDVSVNWNTADGTAESGSDYIAQASALVSIPAGRQSAIVTVQTTDDSDDEADETFAVELSGAVNAAINDAAGEAAITDNDDPPSQDNYDSLIATVRAYAAETNNGADHVYRWLRTLAALGEENGHAPLSAAEARQLSAVYSSSRWGPVVEALTGIEAAQSGAGANPAPLVCVSPELWSDVKDYSRETWQGSVHVERWLKVLHTFAGIANESTIMLPGEARSYADRGWDRWVPVAEAIECLEEQAWRDALSN